MSVQIETGRYYRTRDRRKVGPMRNEPGWSGPWRADGFIGGGWTDNGLIGDREGSWPDDPSILIAEWVDEPAVVTREAIPQSNVSAGPTEDAVHQTKWDGAIKPCPVDPTKIRVGDRVRLGGEFEVVEVSSSGRPFCISIYNWCRLWLSHDMIAEHIPAVPKPKPIEVGDVVRRSNMSIDCEWRVTEIDGNMACIKSLPPATTWWTGESLKNLTRADIEVV